MRVEVLVATMNQVDFSLFEKMNIQTDVIFCNQCDRNETTETYINNCRVRMISTTTRGVGINRNLAMQLSNAEFCLCADDDVVYLDGYEKTICDEFDKNPKVDVFGFNIILHDPDGRVGRRFKKTRRTYRSFGCCRIAFRNESIKRANICFSRMFGGGTKYSCGEDSLFCVESRRKGLNVFCNKEVIADVFQQKSTWFNGLNEKYFYDVGALYRALHPRIWRIFKYYLILRVYKQSKLSLFKMARLMNMGAKGFKNSQPYEDKNENK